MSGYEWGLRDVCPEAASSGRTLARTAGGAEVRERVFEPVFGPVLGVQNRPPAGFGRPAGGHLRPEEVLALPLILPFFLSETDGRGIFFRPTGDARTGGRGGGEGGGGLGAVEDESR